MFLTKMRTGVLHQYQFYSAGALSAPAAMQLATTQTSYPKPGVPHGKLSEKHTPDQQTLRRHEVRLLDLCVSGVDPNVPAALMAWQDGQNLEARASAGIRLITVTDNLVQQGLLPPIVHVMIAPGTSADGKAMRVD